MLPNMLPELNEARFYHSSCGYGSKVYVFGGKTITDEGKSYLNTIECMARQPGLDEKGKKKAF